MIVFNLYAIATGVIIAIVCGILYLIMPNYIAESDLGIIIFVGVGTFISGLCEVGGLAGRLFWIPMWFIGLIATLVLTFMEYGWWGIGGLVGIVVGALALILLLAYFMEKKEWSNAPRALMEFERISDTQNLEFWEELQKAFFFPGMMNYTHVICAHNVSVIEALERKNIHIENLDMLKSEMVQGAQKDMEIKISDEYVDTVKEYIETQIENLSEENLEA